MNFHVRCTPAHATKFFCKKSCENFANPKKLPTFAIPNRYAGREKRGISREKRGISSVGRAFEWHSKGQEFDSPMLHKKEDSQSLSSFFVQQAVLTPALRAALSAKLAHIDTPQKPSAGHLRCAEGRNRPLAHRDHRHSAQERHFGAAVWRRRLSGRGKITIFVSRAHQFAQR